MKDLEAGLFLNHTKHYYTFACTGMKINERDFSTRDSANKYVYTQCAKNGLSVKEVWKDNHDVTFVCNNNVKFYVQRV